MEDSRVSIKQKAEEAFLIKRLLNCIIIRHSRIRVNAEAIGGLGELATFSNKIMQSLKEEKTIIDTLVDALNEYHGISIRFDDEIQFYEIYDEKLNQEIENIKRRKRK